MLQFWKDGNIIELTPILGEGKIGQMIIFGEEVYCGENPNLVKYPLFKYPCPSIFTISEKKENHYIIKDVSDNFIKVDYDFDARFLYDAQEWLKWNNMREIEELWSIQRRIMQKEDIIELLKDIIIKQRSDYITREQANELGLN